MDPNIRQSAFGCEPLIPHISSIVDGTEVPIPTPPTHQQRLLFYSRKKRYAIKYQFHVRLSDGIILGVDGPFPGSSPDINIFKRLGGLETSLLEGEQILGDKGYQGSNKVLHPTKVPRKRRNEVVRDLEPWQKRVNLYIRQRRVRIERTLGRLKRFASLTTPWRHPIDKHQRTMGVLARVTNLHLEDQPLFRVKKW